jgi:hypothetical protein
MGFGVISRETNVLNYALMLSLCSFSVLHPIFRSLFLLDLIFVQRMRQGSGFNPVHVDIQFSQHCLLKRLSFIQCILLTPFEKSKVTDNFCDFSYITLTYMSAFVPIPCWFCYYGSVVTEHFAQYLFIYWEFYLFIYNLRNDFFFQILWRYCEWYCDFDGDCI